MFLGYIASESERLTEIVDELLDVARLESGDLRVDLEPTDVGVIVLDAVTSATGGNGHHFELDLEDSRLEEQADPAKLRHVLDQLLHNAVRFSPTEASCGWRHGGGARGR
jgi:signal transduction histidine kinase